MWQVANWLDNAGLKDILVHFVMFVLQDGLPYELNTLNDCGFQKIHLFLKVEFNYCLVGQRINFVFQYLSFTHST